MDLKTYQEGDAEVQALYARWLDHATRIGFVAALASFALYLSGALPAFVPPADLPALWHLPVEEYLGASGAAAGRHWLTLLGHSDYLAFAGAALFAVVTFVCYARVLPALVARRDRIYAAIALAQLAVLLATATLC